VCVSLCSKKKKSTRLFQSEQLLGSLTILSRMNRVNLTNTKQPKKPTTSAKDWKKMLKQYFLVLVAVMLLFEIVMAQQRFGNAQAAQQPAKNPNTPGIMEAQRKLQELASARAARTAAQKPAVQSKTAKAAAKKSAKFNPVVRRR
jgi:hypothetical protein